MLCSQEAFSYISQICFTVLSHVPLKLLFNKTHVPTWQDKCIAPWILAIIFGHVVVQLWDLSYDMYWLTSSWCASRFERKVRCCMISPSQALMLVTGGSMYLRCFVSMVNLVWFELSVFVWRIHRCHPPDSFLFPLEAKSLLLRT